MDVTYRFISLDFCANGVKSQSPESRGFASAPWVEYTKKIFTPTALYRTFETLEPIKLQLM